MISRAFYFIRLCLFSSTVMLFTVFWGTLGILLFAMPALWRYHFITVWSRVVVWLAKWLCGIRYEIIGRENISSEPGIILCKHQSTWETLVLQFIFPRQCWVLKRELLRVPFFGWALALLKPISINRENKRRAMEQIISQGQARMDEGIWIVIFPEGTRIPAGKHGNFKKGGASLAVATNTPVTPVTHNAGVFWPRRGFWKKPGTIRMIIGKPLSPEGHTPESLMAQARDWIVANTPE